jgi:hypothetical protein
MAGDNEANYQSDVDYVANKAITLDAMKEDVANAELGMLNATAASTESLVSDNLKELARVRANNLTGIGQGDNSTTPSSPSSPGEVVRRRVPQVVNPYDGRIVPYGQMQPGDHSEGGRIVGYR